MFILALNIFWQVVVRGNTICHNDGANVAVLDHSNPTCDGNCLTNGAGRGLVIMDNAKGTYRFNMIRNSELAGVYVGRQVARCLMRALFNMCARCCMSVSRRVRGGAGRSLSLMRTLRSLARTLFRMSEQVCTWGGSSLALSCSRALTFVCVSCAPSFVCVCDAGG